MSDKTNKPIYPNKMPIIGRQSWTRHVNKIGSYYFSECIVYDGVFIDAKRSYGEKFWFTLWDRLFSNDCSIWFQEVGAFDHKEFNGTSFDDCWSKFIEWYNGGAE